MALLQKRKTDLPICLKIVGGPATENDHQYVAQLKQHVERDGLQEIVEFVGNVPFHQIVPYYQHADCFINMSETGSIDKAVLEAMSCEVPVIVNRTFTDILDEELARTWAIDRDPGHVADLLYQLTAMRADERQQLGGKLRIIVVQQHGLAKLCKRIVDEVIEIRTRRRAYPGKGLL